MNSNQIFIATIMVASIVILTALRLEYIQAQSAGPSGCPDPGHCTL